jgi:uncharacterized protein YkwD
VAFVTRDLWVPAVAAVEGITVSAGNLTNPQSTLPPATQTELNSLPNTGNTSDQVLPPPAQATLQALPAYPTPDVGLERLREYMLSLINKDRIDHGLQPVKFDQLATVVGQAHAVNMLENGYFSHWNPAGFGPDLRYAFAGGVAAVQENIAQVQLATIAGEPIPITDWSQQLKALEKGFMSSPGHRANILYPAHNAVGIGIAYDPQVGQLYVAQEFINRYVQMEAPQELPQSGQSTVHGQLLEGASEPLVNLDFEPFPQAMTVAELNQTEVYQPGGDLVAIRVPDVQDGTFTIQVPVNQGSKPGLYHVRVWVMVNGERVQGADLLLVVGNLPGS